MPGWQKMFEPLWKKGDIALAGVVQEQHADRARLYAQWRGIEWPILVDSLNLYGFKVVPISMALDEAGRVVIPRIRSREQFGEFLAAPAAKPAKRTPHAYEPGVRAFLDGKLDDAVAAFGDSPFRLGVALRARWESDARKAGDAQGAVDAWFAALQQDPNQYIWRRRIQQYGPRLGKPYNFYGWIAQARKQIRERGETPLPLRVEPRGAELIDKRGKAAISRTDKDPEGKVLRDAKEHIAIETIVTPPVAKPGQRVRVRFVFRPKTAKWNFEGEPLTVSVAGKVVEADLIDATSNELRVLECEIEIEPGQEKIRAYALYDLCIEDVCVYLRRDLEIPLKASKDR
ncbi:MAG: hypothetical protein ACYTHK_10415 [Planctomycetota bacterium]|jgi:hypothetical protein